MGRTIRSRSRWFALATFGFGSIALGAAAIACSGDDSTAGPGNADASDVTVADNAVDNTVPSQDVAQPDVNRPDTNPPNTCQGATDAASLDDATVQEGMGLVLAFGCAKCHQKEPTDAGLFLNGRTTSISDAGNYYPKNLTPDPDAGIGCWTDPQIAYAILNAVDDQDAALCVMPKFKNRGMDASAAGSITTFLRSLNPDPQQIPESDKVCPPPPDAGVSDADAGDG